MMWETFKERRFKHESSRPLASQRSLLVNPMPKRYLLKDKRSLLSEYRYIHCIWNLFEPPQPKGKFAGRDGRAPSLDVSDSCTRSIRARLLYFRSPLFHTIHISPSDLHSGTLWMGVTDSPTLSNSPLLVWLLLKMNCSASWHAYV